MTVCSYHVTYAFQGESTPYSCLNVKELLARNWSDIWSLSDYNGTKTHNNVVGKRTLNHLAKTANLHRKKIRNVNVRDLNEKKLKKIKPFFQDKGLASSDIVLKEKGNLINYNTKRANLFNIFFISVTLPN